MLKIIYRLVTITCLLFLLVSCAHQPQVTLYEKLGGKTGVDGIVSGLINQIGEDKQIFHYFADTRITRFRTQLTEHLCTITDGPCKYSGDTMTDIHTGMDITEKDFNHLVDLLINAMNLQGIPHRIQNQLLARLTPLRANMIYI
tara:strand:- start:103065 stop:103496 length:432 start_codon:yes stop_codon:yes gene_type:complete